MRFFYLDAFCKRLIIFFCFLIIAGGLVTRLFGKTTIANWENYKSLESCQKERAKITEIREGKKTDNGRVLKYIVLDNGSHICILEKYEDIIDYPEIQEKDLNEIEVGKVISYQKDKQNKENGYNCAYHIQINDKVLFPMEEIKKYEKNNFIISCVVLVGLIILCMGMVFVTICLYRTLEIEDEYNR